jgi:anti-sigma regulatory factor (Ser/Thr protein kinase)
MFAQYWSNVPTTSSVNLISSSCQLDISFDAIRPNFATVAAFCCLAFSLSNSTAVKIVTTEAATNAVTMAIMTLIGLILLTQSG